MEYSAEYYNGSITLRQEGYYTEDEKVNIHPDHVKGLFKAILKNYPDAKYWLDKK